jgi:GPH family glycoside/pentoside/hexuronide:cation symporter
MNQDGKASAQVPTRTRFFWSLSGFATGVITSMSALINQIYITALNYNPKMVNVAKSVPLFAGFITGPLIGHLCDNTRSRWGRRRPWILAGALLSAVLSLLFWFVPKSGGEWNWGFFFFLAVMYLLLMNLGAGSYNTATGAMGFEMTTDYNERTHLFKWRSYMGAIAGFLGPWFWPMCMWFEGTRSQDAKGSEGVIYVALIVAALILLAGLPAVLFCRENVAAHKDEKKVPFVDAVKMTLHNGPFWLLVVSNFIMQFAMNVTGFFFTFILLYYIGKEVPTVGANSRAVMYNTISVAMLLATAPIALLTNRIGKKAALLTALAMSAVAYGSLWITFTNVPGAYLSIPLPWGAADNAITFQWPCLISAVLIGAFTNTMPMIKASMLADICDYDELAFGHRREAFYNSVFGVTESLAIAISLILQGWVLVASGYNAKLPMQSESTMMFWLVAVVVSQPLGFLIGIISIMFYPLSRERMLDIRAKINARKSVAGS